VPIPVRTLPPRKEFGIARRRTQSLDQFIELLGFFKACSVLFRSQWPCPILSLACRSRGGFSTKIHLRTNAQGLPIGATLTSGETHDVKAYEALIEEPAPEPKALIADKGYDADAIREVLEVRGATPMIPSKRNRKTPFLSTATSTRSGTAWKAASVGLRTPAAS
jgi:transposase